ncbi:peptidoglycan D,D-transpeptidase FtsI family protein [Derxia lacustris]|uniref:peptidoglycan D,D-transpeptidase FtsI family protein n=1 Tax=Derxia lacustris TaxID=764842 RepID=UPI000A17694A|nr:penicillin-binding protein 2 [Derxia lacustris]
MRAGAKGVGFASSPVLAVRLPSGRSRLLLALITLAFAALFGRALYLQGITTAFLQKQGAQRYERTVILPAMRGKITDRNGSVVASSLPVKAIWAEEVDPDNPRLGELAGLLAMPASVLRTRLADDDRKFMYLKRQLTDEQAQRVLALGIPGIHARTEFKRYYPEGETLAHVVGFSDIEEVGQEGIERAYNDQLTGHVGKRRVIKDLFGSVVTEGALERSAYDGETLALSIDSKIQSVVFATLKASVEQFKAKAGAAVVLDVQTGEVLALANIPTYDPNDRGHLRGEQLRNRVITDQYEPGSIMKPFTVALALNTKRVTPDTPYNTAPGHITIDGKTVGDSHAHGMLTVREIIQKSSNVGTVKIAMPIPPKEMYEFFSSVGFGQAPKIPFPGASAGRVRPWNSWKPIEQATMAYGHGISVSLLQMARAYTVFARDGDIIPITMLRTSQPAQGTRVVSPEVARQMREMLELASGPGGTAPKAQVVGYRVGGKTGTARKQEGKGYAAGKYISSYVGMAPVSNPRIVIAVMIDDPSGGIYFGGDVAAPAFSQIAGTALRLMNVAPDAPFKASVIAPAASVEESM